MVVERGMVVASTGNFNGTWVELVQGRENFDKFRDSCNRDSR